MANRFCGNCGSAMDEEQTFCDKCGAAAGAAQSTMYVQYVKPKIPGRGLGISGMVLGIIGLVYAVIFLAIVSGNSRIDDVESMMIMSVCSLLALIFGGCAMGKGYKSGVGISGLVMGLIGVVLWCAAFMSIS